jgi:[ribosomal protein S5]-alanine N-acetyltransferase
MTPVTVRDARPDDAAAIERVARASWADTYRDIFEPAYIERFLTDNYAADSLAANAERAATRDDAHFLVAERDGAVVAFAQFGSGPRGPELFRIYADPPHYGTGVGSALLAELHRRIDGRVDSYVLDVHPENGRGRAFYDRNGFVIAGVGATPDCHLMLRRTLRPVRATLPVVTERLRLRRLTDEDADTLHAIYGDRETMRFVGRTGRPTPDLETTHRALGVLLGHDDFHGFSLWAVDERDGDAVVAIAGLLWVDGHGPEVEAAYLVRRDRWGRGYATEALKTVLRIGHGELAIDRIVALAYPDNDASRRVMEKAGMRADGIVEAYGREMTRHVSET